MIYYFINKFLNFFFVMSLFFKSGVIRTIKMRDGTSVRVGTNSHTDRPYNQEFFNIKNDLYNTRIAI